MKPGSHVRHAIAALFALDESQVHDWSIAAGQVAIYHLGGGASGGMLEANLSVSLSADVDYARLDGLGVTRSRRWQHLNKAGAVQEIDVRLLYSQHTKDLFEALSKDFDWKPPKAATSPTADRQQGFTTKQMQEAPIGAFFVWCNGHVDYAKGLARKLGRPDLEVVPSAWLHERRVMGLLLPVVVDHAYQHDAATRCAMESLRVQRVGREDEIARNGAHKAMGRLASMGAKANPVRPPAEPEDGAAKGWRQGLDAQCFKELMGSAHAHINGRAGTKRQEAVHKALRQANQATTHEEAMDLIRVAVVTQSKQS
jgi:hypothetical protein